MPSNRQTPQKRSPEPDANPLGAVDPLPADWPKTGTLDGETIELEFARRTLSPTALAAVVVDVPGVGPMQPWKGSDYSFDADGNVVL